MSEIENQTSFLDLSDDPTGIAELRFALIAPALHGVYTEPSRSQYFKKAAENPITYPDGSVHNLSYKTLEKWYSLYNRFGVEGLLPKTREDKGTTRALNDAAIEEIFKLKKEFPRINATQMYNKLIEEGLIGSDVSVYAVQRFYKNNDLKSARDPNMKDRKAFEMEYFGQIFQADTAYMPYITVDGKSHRLYAVCIIDDYSRYIVAGELFFNDNAYNFQKVLKEAIEASGIPERLLVDNGGPYANEQLALICVDVGIHIIHTHVRDGAGKAKIERYWGSVRTEFEYTTDFSKFHSLEEANNAFHEYIRKYNTSYHSGIDTTPLDRFNSSKEHVRKPKSREWLNEKFLNRINRRVRKDSTVRIDNVQYDVPMGFISQMVSIRYLPDDMDNAFILENNRKYPIRRTNKVENGKTRRKNNLKMDYDKAGR
ncbi:MAG: DDE-type integrase/transposase/recombinase [Solobacterium sp.]|jgi:transposase InsO family protein|nr:DDE-type integrase/transposase/recombinase [Solobacterium sp.]MCH4014126.1 DDE-type integrase/transposase/recombinase [Solobacterium sp.]MCH4014367.1 DDE-type integrase/transposase/recombinase [Solobacterium sp.]MCH4014470.1 DDE-type integrase/transposase/recombinase [Solobacterium sp.]MCH4048613.1 DDE-type integrase/transposase/recombinase [Solobacterium sp.]